MNGVKNDFQKFLAYNMLNDKIKKENSSKRKNMNRFKKSYSEQMKEIMKNEKIEAFEMDGFFIRLSTSQTQCKIEEKHINTKEIFKMAEELMKTNGSERDEIINSIAEQINKSRTTTREAITMNKKKPSSMKEATGPLKKLGQEYIKASNFLKENSKESKEKLRQTGITIKDHEKSIIKYLQQSNLDSATLISSETKYSVFVKETKRTEKITKKKLVEKINSILKRPNITAAKFVQLLVKDVLKGQTPTKNIKLSYSVE